MTTVKSFRCDLCKDAIKPTDYANKEGFGVYFLAGGESVFKRIGECEHHICCQCAKSIHDELRNVTPA